ncbi:MAG: leucyl aminopeptidase, partial [Hyphomicrobiales bacterium]|nr:leucyl aminopeptidase [Hyphomicrobiales bacterium]
GLPLSRLLVVGTGKLADYSEADWMALGGTIRARLSGTQETQATVIVEPASARTKISGDHVAALAAGALLRGYTFLKFKTKKKNGKKKNDVEKDLKKIVIQSAHARAARAAFASRKAVCDGVMFARDLVNEPANVLDPAEFAKRVKALGPSGLKVTVLDEKELKKQKLEALLAVGQGSAKQSYLAVMEWKGAGPKGGAPIAIVGKGVTFDTGGISIKPAGGMEDMKGDMAGAACVAGLMKALAARKAKVNAVGIIGLVENMPSGTATRPGDIIGSMSGQTIEVLNTDAEGRLVLADALWYAQKKFKPKWMVNLATLTGAILVALGKEHAGLFSNDDDLSAKLSDAGEATGEKVWRLPLGPKYDEMIKSKTADMKNIGGRYAGSITAAQFLQRFVEEGTPWAHLDIAGTGMAAPKSDINQSWGSGFGVRLLNRLIADTEEK